MFYEISAPLGMHPEVRDIQFYSLEIFVVKSEIQSGIIRVESTVSRTGKVSAAEILYAIILVKREDISEAGLTTI